ncbi:MAG: flagellar filament outer layer protein FlaA [Spirochaetales bacterium]|nr:flagellar filament outer layer protein FlaA [Spirochaetales bacterium]
MKKTILLSLVLTIALSGALFAQDAGDPNPEQIGITSAQQKLKEISVSKMEDAGLWYGLMPGDEGIIQLRRFEGSPLDKEPIPDEEAAGIAEPDEYVLGAKVTFYRRGMSTFAIRPVRPLPIEGITKTISVWVAGRNTNHVLQLEISDHFGNTAFINMGKLNFVGWKKITVSVPPSIIQRDYHYNNKMGITIDGFNILCDLDETYGSYYIYLDDIRAVTDLFAEESRDEDDMLDGW